MGNAVFQELAFLVFSMSVSTQECVETLHGHSESLIRRLHYQIYFPFKPSSLSANEDASLISEHFGLVLVVSRASSIRVPSIKG